MSGLDHHDHKVARSRLYGRLLQVNGPAHLRQLYPLLRADLDKQLEMQLKSSKVIGGEFRLIGTLR